MKLKTILIIITMIALILSMIFMGSCRKEEAAVQDEIQESADTGKEAAGDEVQEEEGSAGEDTEEQAEDGGQETEDAEDGQVSEEEIQEEAEEEVEVPAEITTKIDEADSLFEQGLYAEASQAYRNAEIAIEGSELPDETKAELIALIETPYAEAKNIVDTARMHHSSAMTLIYEKRYEEAEAELNAALEIYPKYQTAIDALESLEDIRGLQ